MFIKRISVGILDVNCYIVSCEKKHVAVVLDPGGDVDEITEYLNENHLSVQYIINTHGHIDHIGGNDQLRKATGAKVMIHHEDAELLENADLNLSVMIEGAQTFQPADILLHENDVIEFGDLELRVIHTPGHTKGGISLYHDGVLFSGDTLFNGSVGRTDFPGGDHSELLNSIKNKLMILPDKTRVLPGHMSESTIGQERQSNPYLS